MEDAISSWISGKGRLHFTLIDPDKQAPKKAGELASICESYGTDAIMVGGSTVSGSIVDETVKEIKKACRLPVILFPSTAGGVSVNADYVFYMMLMNSNNRRFLVGEQVKAAIPLSKSKVKPISMGYIVVSTSGKPTTVEKVGEVDRILEGDVEKAVSYALAVEYFGMSCVYLEAGSGAEKPVSDDMIKNVKKVLKIPLIVGGGIRDAKTAREKMLAGANIIVTGTIAEKNPDVVGEIIKAFKKP
jgi:phosphoglycerol geranylgeranyltransferase